MNTIISIDGLSKSYDSGTVALQNVKLEIERGEILALLGPNGAGKTTLISAICGLVSPSAGTIKVDGYDTVSQYRAARRLIGLVPQEIALEPFETVLSTVSFSRGLFGKPRDDAKIEQILRDLSLWEKRDAKTMELSGGMRRRVLIAKALSHEPQVLFLDEPTAGVDVELRRGMWDVVRKLRESGVTIILTTHYIEEAEEMADRIGVINAGRLLLVEEKDTLMQRMGQKHLTLQLNDALNAIPASLTEYGLELGPNGKTLTYAFDTKSERTGIARLMADVAAAGLSVRDIDASQRSLEDVFLSLVSEDEA